MGYSKQSSIDVPQCINGHGNLEPKKSWTLKAKGWRSTKETGTKVTHWKCPVCGFSTRTYDKLEKE